MYIQDATEAVQLRTHRHRVAGASDIGRPFAAVVEAQATPPRVMALPGIYRRPHAAGRASDAPTRLGATPTHELRDRWFPRGRRGDAAALGASLAQQTPPVALQHHERRALAHQCAPPARGIRRSGSKVHLRVGLRRALRRRHGHSAGVDVALARAALRETLWLANHRGQRFRCQHSKQKQSLRTKHTAMRPSMDRPRPQRRHCRV